MNIIKECIQTFSFMLRLNIPKYFDEFQIELYLSLHTDSWIDIIAKQTGLIRSRSSGMGLENYYRETFDTKNQLYTLKRKGFFGVLLLEFDGNDMDEAMRPEVMLEIFQDLGHLILFSGNVDVFIRKRMGNYLLSFSGVLS